MTNTPSPNKNEAYAFSMQSWREQFVQLILRAASLLGLFTLLTIFNPDTPPPLRIFYGVIYVLILINTLAPVPYTWRANLVVALTYLLGVGSFLEVGMWGASRIYMLAFVLMANLLISHRASLAALAITIITMTLAGWLITTNTYAITSALVQPGGAIDWAGSGATFLMVAIVINSAINMLKNEFQRSYERGNKMLTELSTNQHTLEERVIERTASLEKRTAELSAASVVARQIAASKDLGSLLPTVADAITEKFGHYHVGIYLLDEKSEFAFLQAASSEGGQRMLARGHQIQISSEGLIGRAVSQRRNQIAQETDANTIILETPDILFTRSRAVLPLFSRERIIGVVDVHSQQPDSFLQSEVETLQIVADQLSLALENARLFTDMQAIIEQMQRTSDYRTYQAWVDMLKRRSPVYQYTPLGIQMIGTAPEARDHAGNLVVPIVLRGQSIGRIHIKRKGVESGWMDQEQAMAKEVASQVALALENARLLEDAQTRAAREKSLSEIIARIGAGFDVDSILRTTAQEIGKALGDAEVSIHILNENNGERRGV